MNCIRATMQKFSSILRLLCLLVFVVSASAADRKPNIIFILADDLGYGDLGSYGQTKFRTPNIDRLAREGMRLTQHYSGSPVCAPSRCVLLTGKHPGHAQIRNNSEVQPEGQRPLTNGTLTVSRILQSNGWTTGAFGKWGLGAPGSSGDPLNQGFDRFFGYNCQRVAHNYYPTSLWDNATIRPLDNPAFRPHQKLPSDSDLNDPKTYAPFSGNDYAPDLIADEALKFIQANQNKPFFLYFPTTVPHLALQVPDDSLREYADKFDDEPYDGSRSYLPHPKPRAAFAAMITRMDRDVGRIIDSIEKAGLAENTIFIFTSDNGPLWERFGGTDSDFFNSARHLRGRKGSVYEGGIRVPCIVRWKGHIAPGTTSDRVTGFEDWLPTLVELAGLDPKVPLNSDGISFAPALLGKAQPERPFLYREFAGYRGQQAVRVGKWKAVRQNLQVARQPIKTELYDLASDPSETTDIAATHPEKLAELERFLAGQHLPSELFPLRALDSNANSR